MEKVCPVPNDWLGCKPGPQGRSAAAAAVGVRPRSPDPANPAQLPLEDGVAVRWVRVPAPTTEEVQQLVTHLAQTVERWLDSSSSTLAAPWMSARMGRGRP